MSIEKIIEGYYPVVFKVCQMKIFKFNTRRTLMQKKAE